MAPTVELPNRTPSSYLPLSEATKLVHEDARTAALIEAWLRSIERVRAFGHTEAAEQLQADLLVFVFGSQRPTASIPESELRLLDGNR